MRIAGEGKSDAILTRAYSNGEFLLIDGNGTEIQDPDDLGRPGDIGRARHPHDRRRHQHGPATIASRTSGITSGSGGTWTLPIFLDGANRTLDPIGIRTVRLDNVEVFNATWWAVEMWNCISCEWVGGGVYQGAGTTDAIVVGGGLSRKNWIQADINWAGSTVWPGALRATH